METTQEIEKKTGILEKEDFLPIEGWDYIELYVGNARQSAFYYQYGLGFQLVAYSGLETGNKEKASYVLQQGKIRIVLSTPLKPDSFISEHIKKHGDGVRDIALTVKDASSAYEETVKRGAKGILNPNEIKDDNGSIVLSAIQTYGETIHTFVERKNYKGIFMPGYTDGKSKAVEGIQGVGLRSIDHIVGNVELGKMNEWVKFYTNTMGFSQLISFDDQDISTEYTALMSKVMENGNGKIKFPINEPAPGKKKSQIEEFIDFYHGAGAQHIAMSTTDIIKTVSELEIRGIQFLRVPSTYYEELEHRVGNIDEDMKELQRLGILVDRDEDGYLLQLFSKPIEDRPTLFIEIIQRKGARSFGKGNFKALFEAIEREQELRGTL